MERSRSTLKYVFKLWIMENQEKISLAVSVGV